VHAPHFRPEPAATLRESEHLVAADARDLAPSTEADADLGFPADDMPHVELPLIAMDDADTSAELPLLEPLAPAERAHAADDALECRLMLHGRLLRRRRGRVRAA